MTDIVIEIVRAVLLALIVTGLVMMGRRYSALTQRGWYCLLSGFVLLLFGCILDVTDNFVSLNRFVIIGDTKTEAVLEKLVGFLGGFVLLAIGLVRWLPNITSLAELRKAHRQLEETNSRLRRADRTKSEFLANMSHEIRTPMSAILGYAEVLEQEVSEDPEQARDAIRTIHMNANHLLAIINDILDVSKIEAGQMSVEAIDTNLIQIIEEVASLVRPQAMDKGLDIHVHYDSPFPDRIQSDPTRLRQILLNLVTNAIKFTNVGSVHIHADCNTADRKITLRVVDTGIGMTPEQREAIARFEAFSQADTSTTRKYGGSGLGLRISSALAHMLGGSIEIESAIEKGSTFAVTIGTGELQGVRMLQPESISQTLSSLNGRVPSSRDDRLQGNVLDGVSILLVEDSVDNQRLISHHLKKAGASVAICDNGLIAVEAIEQAHPSELPALILMDMQMPVLDGYSATKRLRSSGFEGPIIALTAHAMEGDRIKCVNAGCDDYLTKPIAKDLLIDTCVRRGKRDAPSHGRQKETTPISGEAGEGKRLS